MTNRAYPRWLHTMAVMVGATIVGAAVAAVTGYTDAMHVLLAFGLGGGAVLGVFVRNPRLD